MGQFSKDMVAFLEAKGFRQYPSREPQCVVLQRRLADEEYTGFPGCFLNDGKLFINVQVYELPIRPGSQCVHGVTIELTAQAADGRSFKIEQYGSRLEGPIEEFTTDFDETCRRLVRAWAAINEPSPEPVKEIETHELVVGSQWLLDCGKDGSVRVEITDPPTPLTDYVSVGVRVIEEPLPKGFARTGFASVLNLLRIR